MPKENIFHHFLKVSLVRSSGRYPRSVQKSNFSTILIYFKQAFQNLAWLETIYVRTSIQSFRKMLYFLHVGYSPRFEARISGHREVTEASGILRLTQDQQETIEAMQIMYEIYHEVEYYQ